MKPIPQKAFEFAQARIDSLSNLSKNQLALITKQQKEIENLKYELANSEMKRAMKTRVIDPIFLSPLNNN